MKIHELIITAAVMWILAWMFIQGWERQEFVDQALNAERKAAYSTTKLDSREDSTPPMAPSWEPDKSKVHHFQDASRKARGTE